MEQKETSGYLEGKASGTTANKDDSQRRVNRIGSPGEKETNIHHPINRDSGKGRSSVGESLSLNDTCTNTIEP